MRPCLATWRWWWVRQLSRTWARPTATPALTGAALDRLMELTSGVRVSAHVPAPTSNRQNVVIKRGMSMTAVAPVWEGITIIPDEVTKAGTGQIVITAVMLYAMKVLRTGAGLVKQGTDHS